MYLNDTLQAFPAPFCYSFCINEAHSFDFKKKSMVIIKWKFIGFGKKITKNEMIRIDTYDMNKITIFYIDIFNYVIN